MGEVFFSLVCMLWFIAIVIVVILVMYYYFDPLLIGGSHSFSSPELDVGARQVDTSDDNDVALARYLAVRDATAPVPETRAGPVPIISGSTDEIGPSPLPALIFQT